MRENIDDDLLETDLVLLEVRERLRRQNECGKPSLIYLKKDIEQDIKKYCRGNRTSIINRLIREGLKRIKKD